MAHRVVEDNQGNRTIRLQDGPPTVADVVTSPHFLAYARASLEASMSGKPLTGAVAPDPTLYRVEVRGDIIRAFYG